MSSMLWMYAKGETIDDGFLPESSYLTINGVKYPLGCHTMKVPKGNAQLDIYSPAMDRLCRLEYTFLDTELLLLELEVDSSRNVVDAVYTAVALKDLSPEQLAIIPENMELADKMEPEIDAWRARYGTSAPEPGNTPASNSGTSYSGKTRSGKAIGWGLAITLFFVCGIIGICTNGIENKLLEITESFSISYLTIYSVLAGVGLLIFVLGMIPRKK